VSHATSFRIPVEVQRALTARGAFIEQCAVNSFREGGDAAFAAIAADVRAVGPEHVVLSTDLGQAPNPAPPVGFGSWIERFLDAGFSTAEVRRMVQENPAAALG
jgi:microsomal dipeptidase-like Zn-dependent dipeptidase